MQGLREPANVIAADVGEAVAAATPAQVAGFDAPAQVANDRPVQGDLVDDDFQAVVLRRIVAAGHHHPGATGAEGVGGVVQQRRRDRAQIQHVQPGGVDAGFERLAQQWAGQPRIAPDDHGGFAPFAGEAAYRLADVPHHVRCQVAIHHAANVVLPKNGFLHRSRFVVLSKPYEV